ncbi:MAG TPA: EamA family transporter [Pseudogracilibacillus sp.]|nr:EamA family transporter [Pseudogracilibacillus sp.]
MNRAYLMIIIGATLWGTIAFYVKKLYEIGFTPMEVVTLRVFFAAVILVIFLAVRAPNELRLKQFSDISYFIGTGIVSIIFFNYSLFKTIEVATIPIAYALLYTAPAFVILLSFILFKEQFTRPKVIALLITLIGVIGVVELNPLDLGSIHLRAIMFGLGSGLGYALYSIFSKFALRTYSSLQITTFTFVVAALVLTPSFLIWKPATPLIQVDVFIYAFGIGFLPTAVAYVIYTAGLERVEASKASIIATIEPVVATIIGIAFFFEPFSIVQIFGMGCIIFAVMLIQWSESKSYRSTMKRQSPL